MWGSKSEKSDKTAIALEKLSDTFNNILENEKMSRDRVDISLAEYERLKNENKRLQLETIQLSLILERLGFPKDILDKIQVETVNVYHIDTHKNLTTRYRIEFDVDNF